MPIKGRAWIRLGSIVLAAVLVLSGCAPSSPATPPDARNDRWLDAVLGLCDSVSRASGNDVQGAEGAFVDRSHGPLHEIAAEVQGVDRPLAADLLVAKNRVEEDFRSGADSGALLTDFRALLDATANALTALELEVPPCEGQD